MSTEFEWDMAISYEEFVRCLPDAVDRVAYSELGNTFEWDGDGVRWRIELEPLPPRVIALLRLPRHRVRFRLEGFDAAAQEAWIERFKRYFQRGGG